MFTLVIATGSVLANPLIKNLLKQLNADEELGDKGMITAQKRQGSIITVKTADGEETTTEILPEDGYEIVKPEGKHICFVRPLDQEPVDRNGCVEKTPLTADQVPQAVAERCGSRPMYVLSQCENESENRRMVGEDIQKRITCYARDCHEHSNGDTHCYVYC